MSIINQDESIYKSSIASIHMWSRSQHCDPWCVRISGKQWMLQVVRNPLITSITLEVVGSGLELTMTGIFFTLITHFLVTIKEDKFLELSTISFIRSLIRDLNVDNLFDTRFDQVTLQIELHLHFRNESYTRRFEDSV